MKKKLEGLPDLKNGFTRIANELLEAIMKARITLYQKDICLAVIRQTYGFQASKRQISIGRIHRLTGIPRSRVEQEVVRLVEMKVLVKQKVKSQRSANIFNLNKHYQEWQAEWRIPSPQRVGYTLSPEGRDTLSPEGRDTLSPEGSFRGTKERERKKKETNIC
jgi:phage replication O-like protein O